MDLRPATPDDLTALRRLHSANWRRDYAGLLSEAALGNRLDRFMAEKWTPQALRDARVVVAGTQTELAGFAVLRPDGPDGCAFLDNLHVDARWRAQGVGRSLMAAVAVLAGEGALTLEVLEANRSARAIYKAWGGREGAVFRDEILGIEVPALAVGWTDAGALARRLRGDLC